MHKDPSCSRPPFKSAGFLKVWGVSGHASGLLCLNPCQLQLDFRPITKLLCHSVEFTCHVAIH